jgi:hypothetical protein
MFRRSTAPARQFLLAAHTLRSSPRADALQA